MPFPPLNKYTPTTDLTECKTKITDGDNVTKATIESTDDLTTLTLSDVFPPVAVHTYPLSALDWSVLSQQLLDVLQAAVQVRVDHAPKVPSNTSGPSTDHNVTSLSSEEQSELSSRSAIVVSGKDNETAPSYCDVQSLDQTKDVLQTQRESFSSLDEVRRKESGRHHSLEYNLQDKAAHCEVRVERSIAREGGARVAVLYSGGVDSTVLAALTDRYVWVWFGVRHTIKCVCIVLYLFRITLIQNFTASALTFFLCCRCVPKGEEIDLINVAFEQKSATVEKRYTHSHLNNHVPLLYVYNYVCVGLMCQTECLLLRA